MPVDNNQKGVKNVQTLLAPKKPGAIDKDSAKEKPPKQNKRSHSDVANESVEGVDMIGIQSDLSEIKQSLRGTVTKSDLKGAMDNLVQQKDLKVLVTDIVQKLLTNFEEKITKKIEHVIWERTGKLQDQLDSLMIENENIRERIRAKDKIIESLEERVQDNTNRSIEALKLANYNEQYSRKHNIRMVNYPEKKGEILRDEFVNLVKTELKVEIQPSDVQAIHRIPGKDGFQKPVIVKVRNTDVKIQIMRQKKNLTKDVKFHDDITQRNLGLMARLKNTEKFENVWFYNCNVYAKPEGKSRIRYDLFDNIDEKLKKKLKLKRNPDIQGITINDDETLLSQYADDTFLILDGREISLKETLSCFESFYKASGLKMNASKTKAVWVGNKKYSDLILCPESNLHWSHSNFKLLGIEFSLDLNRITEINFSKKIKEVSAILKSWQHRKLTLMGKITVIKSLALSKLVHLLTALPNLTQSRLNELTSLFYNFIWNNKPDRVKRNTLIGDITQGGLNMIHIHSFNIYLKLSWIKRLLTNPEGKWQKLFLTDLKQYGGERVLYLQKEKLREISVNLKNPFWSDVLLCLSEAKPHTDSSVNDILSLDILNFSSLDDFPYYLLWKNRGVQFVSDLINHENKQFYSFEQIQEKLETNNFLMFYRLIARIPKAFKDCLKENLLDIHFDTHDTTDTFVKKIVSNKKAKFIYRSLIDNIVQNPTDKFLKWEELLDIEITDWSEYFVIMKRSCRDTYLRNFQFKFLHRIIATNSFLYKIKLKDTHLCTFCKANDETIEHLFFDCPISYRLWQFISNRFKLYFVNFVLNKENIFLGCKDESLLLNLLIILTKNYIYKCKLNEAKPNTIELKNKIKKYQSFDQYIAKKNNTVQAYEKFWAPIYIILN